MKKTLFYFFTLMLFYLCLVGVANATTLSAAAAALAPGQFVQVGTLMTNLQATAAAYDPAPASPGPGYDGGQPGWDPLARKLYMEMTEHGNASACPGSFPAFPNWCWKPLWTYDDATNTWTTNGPYPTYTSGGGPVSGVHTWGYVAWDVANKALYVRGHDTNIGGFWWSFFRYCATNSPASYCASQLGQWQQITGFNPPSGSQVGTQLGWMPTLNGGTLLAFDTDGNNAGCGALFGYREGVGWATVDSGASCKFPVAATTLNRIIYSPQKNVAIFGPTGSSGLQWWKIDSAGTRTTLDTAPCVFHTTDNGFSQTAEDPNTGDIIFIGCTAAGQMWRLNPTASPGSQWTEMHATLNGANQPCNVVRSPGINCGFDFLISPISTYGVIGIWKMRLGVAGGIGPAQQGAEFWLYKPSATSSDVTPPTVSITAPTAGATVTGAAVTLTATASDNVGVAGVQFKVDGVATGSEDTVAPYSISWNSTTVSNGSHIITATARDAAGNSTTSAGVAVTVSNGGADFATRCIGAFFCNGFDTAADLGGDGFGNARGHGPPDDSGSQFCGVNNCPTIDAVTKISGAGAMKFTIPPGGSGKDGGSYWANPSTDLSLRFGAGQTWYVQFRQRVTASYAAAAANNNKIHWVSGRPDLPGCTTSTAALGNCFATCTENEVVNQNQYTDPTKAFPRWYTACPGPNNFELIQPITPGQYNLENGRTAPGCLYDNVAAGNIFPPNGNCFPFSFDQWVTWSYKITLGAIGTGAKGGLCFDASNPSIPLNKQNCYYGGQILARAGLDGQPLTTVLNWTGPMVAVDNRLDINGNFIDPTELKYGKVWFAPYTGAGSVLPSGANIWVDELIMSLNPIPDPSATPDTTNPTVAITSPIPPTTSTTTSPITVSGTATDNISVTSVTWTCIQCITKGGTATSSPGTSISWSIPALDLVSGTNTLNVVAHDAAGNASTAATLTIAYAPRPIRYVSPTGNDSNSCAASASTSFPKQHFEGGSGAIACMAGGDTLILLGGTYPKGIDRDSTIPNGTAGAPTTFTVAPGATAILQGSVSQVFPQIELINGAARSYITFDGGVNCGANSGGAACRLILDGNTDGGGITIGTTNHHIIVTNFEDKNATNSNGIFSSGTFTTFSNCNIHDHGMAFGPGDVSGSGGYGMYLGFGSDVTMENCRVHHNGGFGIHVNPSSDVPNLVFRYNDVYANGQISKIECAGILLAASPDAAVYSNIVHDNIGNCGGILTYFFKPVLRAKIYNNTVTRNYRFGISMDTAQDSLVTNNLVGNNNLSNGGFLNIQTASQGTGNAYTTNGCFDASGTGGGTAGGCNSSVTPNFVNPLAANFRLQTGSTAINVGTALPVPYNTDIAGIARPQGAAFDLGAYESVAAAVPPVVTIVNPTSNPTIGVSSPIFSLGGTSNLP